MDYISRQEFKFSHESQLIAERGHIQQIRVESLSGLLIQASILLFPTLNFHIDRQNKPAHLHKIFTEIFFAGFSNPIEIVIFLCVHRKFILLQFTYCLSLLFALWI